MFWPTVILNIEDQQVLTYNFITIYIPCASMCSKKCGIYRANKQKKNVQTYPRFVMIAFALD